MKEALFIINQRSGGSRNKKDLSDRIKRRLGDSLFSFNLVFTQYKGHATRLAKEAVSNGIDLIVAVGGDGSVNEVAKATTGSHTATGIIPLGSGNGLARTLGIPVDIDKALEIIKRYKTKQIDVGFISDHLFLSNAGIGFDALVAKNFEGKRRRGLGQYASTIIRSVKKYDAPEVELHVEGTSIREKSFITNIANGTQLGYNFKIASHALLDDGLLNLTLVKSVPVWRLPHLVVRSFTGTLDKSPHVQVSTINKLLIKSVSPITLIQVDGEPIEVNTNEIKVLVRPKALKMVIP